ncbi:hypothetical protein [endosymbiont of unidentified scaly snail isolate Monju]|uniref:hypothetical protein n=1 Tax=endosymbiont of unidentified scaly snail isolate Monju TaxID=1248727 RepID=UPI0011DD4A82|nr:hypothetical protein [endosymbiont of unidentified scaly snail isolate Monju]
MSSIRFAPGIARDIAEPGWPARLVAPSVHPHRWPGTFWRQRQTEMTQPVAVAVSTVEIDIGIASYVPQAVVTAAPLQGQMPQSTQFDAVEDVAVTAGDTQ